MTSDDTILKDDVHDLREALDKGKLKAVDLVDLYLARIKKSKLGAFITVTEEKALRAARAADQRLQSGAARPLEGIPVGIKDIFATKNVRTTCASRMLENFVPTYESTVTARLWKQGAVLMGKLNMDEFAMGTNTSTSYFGPTRNPWRGKPDCDRSPGGSSGGSAAAVAGYLVAAALGSDTGGSVRQPAALTGLVGLRPTYGRLSRFGMVAYGNSLDQAGVLTRSVRDSALFFTLMTGEDLQDQTTAHLPPFHWKSSAEHLRVFFPDEAWSAITPYWNTQRETVEKILTEAHTSISSGPMKGWNKALAIYYILAPAEASSNLLRFDGVRYGYRAKDYTDLASMYLHTRSEGFGIEVQKRITMGTYYLSTTAFEKYFLQAQRARRVLMGEFQQIFKDVDLIITPTSLHEAQPLANLGKQMDRIKEDLMTSPSAVAGLPSISIPVGLDKHGLPMGLQIIGKPFGEESLFTLAHRLEERIGRLHASL